MNIILFDDPVIREDLLPFTFIRPVAEIRVGILTIAEKWKHVKGADVSYQTEAYLSGKYPTNLTGDNYFINGAICPDEEFINRLKKLSKNDALVEGDKIWAIRTEATNIPLSGFNSIHCENVVVVDKPWKIFQFNGSQIKHDYEILTKDRKSHGVNDVHTKVYNIENIFIEEGVTIRAAILNAENGPIYLGKNSHVHEGAIIRGSFSLGEQSHVNMGAKVRGDTTVGPFSKIGGEVSNTVIFGYSNKAHDGFLGNSVIGEWCNFGADSNTSNLKNNFENIKLWNYTKNSFVDSGLLFCGLMMGDHSKCGINTMFNTGTVVGISANIFGAGFPRNFIPSFAWGGATGFTTFKIDKALKTASMAMERRQQKLTEVDINILKEIYSRSSVFRTWERIGNTELSV